MASMQSFDPAALDPSVKGVMFHFNVSNKDLVSSSLHWKNVEPDPENLPGSAPKHSNPLLRAERQFLGPTINIGLAAFAYELRDAGFVMTSAEGRIRGASKSGNGKLAWAKVLHRVRFIFNRAPLDRAIEKEIAEYLKLHGEPSFERLIKESMWSVEGFRNPLRDGSGSGLSLSCANRTPYYLRPGVPNIKRKKGPNGEVLDETPKPVVPDAFVRLLDGRVVID